MTQLTTEQHLNLMAEAAQYGERWYQFTAYNSQARYGFGSDADATKYCEFLNRDREINVFSAEPMEFVDALGLDRGDDTSGFRLDEELDAQAEIDEANAEQAESDAEA